MSGIDTLLSSRAFYAKPRVHSSGLCPAPILTRRGLERSSSVRGIRLRTGITRNFIRVFCESSSGSTPPKGDDFVARVLQENPSQVEPRYLIGDKFYTLKERENLSKNTDVGAFEILRRTLDKRVKSKRGSDEGQDKAKAAAAKEESVYLKDLLREYEGKLYVPEQVFGEDLSEEEEFDRNLEALPKMSLEDFRKAMESDKVKLLTSKEVPSISTANVFRDFIVELKEIPGDRSLHRTRSCISLLVVFCHIVCFKVFFLVVEPCSCL